MKVSLLVLAALSQSGAPPQSPPLKMPPVEQCGTEHDFQAFRKRLVEAVTNNDKNAFLPLLASDVLADFGGGTGRDLFAERLDNSGDELWMQLEQVIHLGCALSGDTRVIPSLAVQLGPYADEDPYVMVTAARAEFRASPEYGSPPIGFLSWDVVTVINHVSDIQSKVRTADGREGWMIDKDLYSPIGHRFVLEKRGGKWMVTALVAGD